MKNFIHWLESWQMLGIKVFDYDDSVNLLFRLGINLLVSFVLIHYIYYPKRQDKEYYFTFVVLNTLVFFVCHLLSEVKFELGFAFGIFALFSILRYRTTTLPVVEMSYLFAVIAIGLVNAMSNKKVSYFELLFTNAFITGVIYVLDVVWMSKQVAFQTVVYEKIENIKPENREQLITDLAKRTGLNITRVEVGQINFINDSARIKLFYIPEKGNIISSPERG